MDLLPKPVFEHRHSLEFFEGGHNRLVFVSDMSCPQKHIETNFHLYLLRMSIILEFKIDEFVKSHSPVLVIPANAGIQGNHPEGLDSCFRGSAGLGCFLRDHRNCARFHNYDEKFIE